MKRNKHATCDNCPFWEKGRARRGTCVRMPRHMFAEPTETWAYDYCGQHPDFFAHEGPEHGHE